MLKERTLEQCTITLTRNCNLRCSFCYAKGTEYKESDILNFEEYRKIVDFCCEAKVKSIVFTGGEPLLYPRLIDAVRYIKEKDPAIMVAMATNGILLDDSSLCKRLVHSGMDYIDISMKGTDAEQWQRTTGAKGFARQFRAIHNLSLLPVECTCSMVITPENASTFCQAVEVAVSHGGKSFSFTFVIDNEDSAEKDVAYLRKQNPFSLVGTFLSQMDRLNALTDDWWIEYSFPLCVYTTEQLTALKGRLAAPCQVHMGNAVTFDTNGSLIPCNMFFHLKTGQFGKDFNSYNSFVELQTHPEYRGVIETLQALPSVECTSCSFLESCYGGCPVLWKNYSFNALKAFKKQSPTT